MENTKAKPNPMLKIFSIRDFRLLFAGAATAILGDQFTLIATPWLVLKLTNYPLRMGIVLALEDIPRAIFMLLGAGNGYIAIMLFTWMQTRMPKEMLGRMMSMLILSGMGLVPISQAISGAVRKWSLTNLFVIAGGLNLLIPTWAVFQPGSEALKSRLAAEN